MRGRLSGSVTSDLLRFSAVGGVGLAVDVLAFNVLRISFLPDARSPAPF